MMFIGFLVVFLSLLQAVAADPLPGLLLPNHDFIGIALRQLSARQTQPPSSLPNVPTECQADCNPINTQLSQPSGCPPTDCCKAAFITGFFNCLKCVGVALGATDFTSAQAMLDELTQQCSAHGFNVPQLTFPGISASNSPTSVSLSIRSTATVSRPAQSTISVLTSIPNPSPPPTTTFSQMTVTALSTTSTTPLSITSTAPQAPPQTTSNAPSTNSAKSNPFFTSHFSQLSASFVLLLGIISFVL